MGLWLAAHPWVALAAVVFPCVVCAWFGLVLGSTRAYRAGWADANEEHDQAAEQLARARSRGRHAAEPAAAPEVWRARLPFEPFLSPEPPTVVNPTAILSPLPHPDSAAAERKAGPDTLARGFLAVRNDRFAAALPEGWRR